MKLYLIVWYTIQISFYNISYILVTILFINYYNYTQTYKYILSTEYSNKYAKSFYTIIVFTNLLFL